MKIPSVYNSPEGKRLVLSVYEKILQQWPIPYEIKKISTSYGETAAIVSGADDLPALILLHGSSSNSAMWINDVEALSQHYQVFAVDIIGEPGFSAETRPDHKDDHCGIWLEEVMMQFNLMRATVIGNSLGGWMALQLAKYRPNRVTALVLLAPSGLAPARLSFVLKAIPLALMGSWGANKLNQIVYGQEEIPEKARRFSTLIMNHFTPRIGSLPVITDTDLKKLTMPILYIGGEKDALLHTQDSAERLQQLLPHAITRIIPNTGHVLIHEQEEYLNFLKKCSANKKTGV
jgi:pimeloyl-ACP methyl ester carboxylesterase